MKILKIIGIVVLSLIALVLIVAAVSKNEYAVERTVVINKPKSEVFDYAKMLKNQNEYSYWAKQDPNMKKEFRGTDGTVGFVSAWDGNKDVGKGEQEIKAITDGEKVDYELRFMEPMEAMASSYMTTSSESDNATKVSWGMSSKMAYPMNIMLVFMDMDKMVGEQLQTGLDNMKQIVESQPSPMAQTAMQSDTTTIARDSLTQTQVQ